MMKIFFYFYFKNWTRNLLLMGWVGLSFSPVIHAAPIPSAFGVWNRGEEMDIQKYPFIRGLTGGLPWSEGEPKPGQYNWSNLDQALNRAVKNDQSVFLTFATGPDVPTWIYEKGVPKVETNDNMHKSKFPYYPYYPSPEYKMYYQRYIMEVAKHIRSLPIDTQKRIAFIQVQTGCTGDETPYKGDAKESQYKLGKGSKEWDTYRVETFQLYSKLFSQEEPKISLLFNAVSVDEEGDVKKKDKEEPKGESMASKWVKENVTDAMGKKIGGIPRGHHLAEERVGCEAEHDKFINPKGTPMFAIAEMDQTWTRPLFQRNLPLGFYWAAINGLNYGLSIWDVVGSAMEVSKEYGFDYAFYFFNKYAGQIYPETATDAFCALHKGLDSSDKNAYPESKYGSGGGKDIGRMEKIVAEYAKYGAAIEDKEALTLGQVGQRGNQKGYNDVGREIWPDNYSRFLYQIDADATSIPLWRIGGPITPTSSIYSRFARGFEHASEKDAMYFKLENGFSKGNEPKVMTITVVWYDKDAGSSWNLDYDAGAGSMKRAVTVTGKGDNQWHHEEITLKDAVFQHGGDKGSDLALVNADGQDDIFSLIEVHRGVPVVPALRPPTEVKPPPSSLNKGTKYDNKGAGKSKKEK